ncbi:hypothetical protein [Parasulfitobacter algicola]|uniref:Lipoprotein n=1 Tax=Parasulfitobacter algicola TaxID=2614809 RepID=A0ABX2J045_9RHOB|nr:hypothetical protein [Sulfitobacter algicola]NSX56439.1 hypothetical protein [Sulfitobacter algicola]
MKNGLLLMILLLLAACGSPKPGLVTSCMFEVKPPGTYESTDLNSPTVVPGDGGTQAGADALNDCIRRKAA